MFTSYLTRLCLLTALFLGGIGAVNFRADPNEVFMGIKGADEKRLVVFPSRRTWANVTINRVRHGGYQTLVMGNSRAWMGIDPDYPAPDGNIYNASFSGCSLENMHTVLRFMWDKNTLSTIIIGLDFTMERKVNDLTNDDFTPVSALQSALGFQTLKDSLATHKEKWSQSHRVLSNGFRPTPPKQQPPEKYRSYLDQAERSFREVSTVPVDQGRGWFYLERIVNECRTRNIRLILFVSPFHAEILDRMAACGVYDDFETWMRKVVDIAHGGPSANRSDVAVWQFCGYNPITTEPFPDTTSVDGMRWYFEASHYKPEVGNLILDRIFERPSPSMPEGFGIRLTRKNIDLCCEKIRTDLMVRTSTCLNTPSKH
ncbi:hypothetical protein [Desulfoluna butyratoxydans]|uniref:Uncharacterized protein n=1 Tax=Desulfoluna butyratoxydans TaxID=231438 RepID=A0A4U8YXB8_9BACT|nr:hypothetical protein [Desulfoluna butyratoxydans]VFQ46093.1 hypothetical protein MSL71_37560 [Desulfoluna butyratoxydans]